MFLSSVSGVRIEIASRLNEAEEDNTEQYTVWINMGIRDIARSIPNPSWFQTSADRTLSSGTRIYSLPADFDRMNGVTYPAGDVKLTFLESEQFDILQPSATESGTPRLYTIRGLGNASPRIEFYPSPGGSYTLHYDYIKLPTTVSAASAVPDIPEKYLELLVLYGEASGLRRKGLRNDAAGVAGEYEALKNKMIQELNQQSNENPRIKSGREFMANNNDYGNPITNAFWLN